MDSSVRRVIVLDRQAEQQQQHQQRRTRFTMADQNKDAAKAKAEQEYMERLAKEFSSLPDRDVPQGESSGSNREYSPLRLAAQWHLELQNSSSVHLKEGD
jgi:hypothetical protein